MSYEKNDQQNQEEFERPALTREQALGIFSEKDLSPQVSSPWKIVKFQCVLTITVTMLSIVWSMFFYTEGLVVSVLLGGVLGVIPTSAFIIRVNLFKKTQSRFANRFVSTLVYAEVIKITLTLTIMMLTIRLFPNLNWLCFLGMYVITLQSYWLIGFIKKK